MSSEKTLPIESRKLDLSDYQKQVVSLSNSIIRSKEYTNLLESKIEVLAIYYMDQKLRQRKKTDSAGNAYMVNYVDLPSSEIRKLMGRKDGETYTEIKKAARSLKSKIYIVEDRENSRFYMKSMYGDVSYDKGILSIEFEPGMEKYFMNLKDNYTRLRLETLFSFRRNGGLQLYKLLRSYVYPPNLEPIDLSLQQEELPVLKMTWSVSELRMIMGYVNIYQDELQEEAQKTNPNWDKMVSQEKKPQYRRWSDFKSRVIDPGIKEINDISDIYICGITKEYSGHGGKTSKVTFLIQHNRKFYKEIEKDKSEQAVTKAKPVKITLTEDQKFDFIDEIRTLITTPVLKIRDYSTIAEAADYDMDKIKEAYSISKGAGEIRNFTGWMIKAIKEGYDEPVSVKGNSTGTWHGDLEREYDFDNIEKQLSKKQKERINSAAS